MAGLVAEQGPDDYEMQCFPLMSFVLEDGMAGLVSEKGPDDYEMQCFPLMSFVLGRNGWSGGGERTG